MEEITLVIPGTPISKKRPRFFRRGKFVGTYNCQETEEGRFMWELKSQLPKGFALIARGVPVILKCQFFFPIPRSASKKRQALMEEHKIKHTNTPDLDNCIKFVKDCMTSIVWQDDCQVVRESSMKEYSDTPKTVIMIELKHHEPIRQTRGKKK
jgi:Holliday junction resolvase RusA-like endonuclease